jgi:tripeptide aminopeptidase
MSNEKLLLELIKIRSESGNEKAIGDYICHWLGRSGFVLKKQAVNRAAGNFNIYAGVGRPKVIFSNHIDNRSGLAGGAKR